MEAEAAHLEAPPPEIGWDELLANSAKHEQELETRERRRGILPRLLTAAKIKRLELQRERWEQEIEPLKVERDEAYERLEAAEAKLTEAQRERNLAQGGLEPRPRPHTEPRRSHPGDKPRTPRAAGGGAMTSEAETRRKLCKKCVVGVRLSATTAGVYCHTPSPLPPPLKKKERT
jgi:hypothetical protein